MADSTDTVGALKAMLRVQARQRRAGLDPVVRAACGTAIAEHAWALIAERLPLASPIACTWSMPTEPPTDPLIARLHAAGIEVLTPRILEHGGLAWVPTPADALLEAGPLGIRTPVGSGQVDLGSCALIFVPALALDRHGNRLGHGGGYFDRALSQVQAHDAGGPLRIGVAYADDIVDRLPCEEHDQGVDLIVTELGITALDITAADST